MHDRPGGLSTDCLSALSHVLILKATVVSLSRADCLTALCRNTVRYTKSMNVVSECLDMFNVLSVADYIVKRKCKFLTGYINSQNFLCNLLCRTAKKDLSDMTLR